MKYVENNKQLAANLKKARKKAKLKGLNYVMGIPEVVDVYKES